MVGIVIEQEKVASIFAAPNWTDLIASHHEEAGVHKDKMALAPDYERVQKLEELNMFRAWSAREEGLLVGYIAFHVIYHLHYKHTLTAIDDLFMLAPLHRRGTTGWKMFRVAMGELEEMGVKRFMLHDKVAWTERRAEHGLPAMDMLFARLGFELTDRIWSRHV